MMRGPIGYASNVSPRGPVRQPTPTDRQVQAQMMAHGQPNPAGTLPPQGYPTSLGFMQAPAAEAPREEQRVASMPPDAKITVSCCGRNVQVDAGLVLSLSSVAAELQRELTMTGQAFEIFDVDGTNLPTDKDMLQAIASGRTPLVATLSDGTIHYIENRREELSQMQWKVVRDQINGLGDKIMALGRHVQELHEATNVGKREMEQGADRLRHEMYGLVDDAKDVARQHCMQAMERTDSLSHFIHSERNTREAAIQGVERQVQGARDAIDADKSTRRQEVASAASMLDQYHLEFLEEVRAREALEDRHKFDVHRLNERIDVLPRLQAEPLHDLSEEIKKAQLKFQQELEDTCRQLMQVTSLAENVQYECSIRNQKAEERCQLCEDRIVQVVSRNGAQFSELWAKTEKLADTAVKVRLEERGRGLASAVQSALTKVDELEDLAKSERGLSVSTTGAREEAVATSVSDPFSVARATAPVRAASAEPPAGYRRAPGGNVMRSVTPPTTIAAGQRGAAPLYVPAAPGYAPQTVRRSAMMAR